LEETSSLSLCPSEVFAVMPLCLLKLPPELRAALRLGEVAFYGLF